MKSIKEIYKIGKGPSSSHTMGPQKACELFRERYPDADSFKVYLYGSLAKTGKGHGTDKVISETLAPREVAIEFVNDAGFALPHANTMELVAYLGREEIGRARALSIGGGEIVIDGFEREESPDIYNERNFTEIVRFCRDKGITLHEYAELHEGAELYEHLARVWKTMTDAIEAVIKSTGILPGGLNVEKKASTLYNVSKQADEISSENRLVSAYAFAVSEQNADNGVIVTAPTCGSCGVLPAVLKYMQDKKGYSDREILQALAAAGVVGNVVKRNASLSGAECGCQAEVGTACSMAAAALSELAGLDLDRIEYAAEIAMEHHIGLTCDPVCGLVQIPCIERNAVAALRAMSAADLAGVLGNTNKVSFDTIVKTMYETGKDLSSSYKETSEGGLAKLFGKSHYTEEIRWARASEYDELMTFLDRAFGFEKEEDKFINLLPKLYKKEYEPCSNNIVLCDENGISGAVGLYPFYYNVAGERLRGVCLGNVASAPEARSRGYMSKMMKRSIDEIDSSGADFAVLGGQRQRYERFGFYQVTSDLIFTFNKANVKYRLAQARVPSLSIKEVSERDEWILDGIYALFNTLEVRAERERERLYDILLSWRKKLFAVLDGERFVGYYLESGSGVHELTLSEEKYFYPLIAAYVDEHSSMKIHFPPYDRNLIRLASAVAEQTCSETWEMFRISRFAETAGAFLKLAAKQRELSDGELVLLVHHERSDERFELSVKDGRVKVNPNTKKYPMLELNEAEASSLLFSNISETRDHLPVEVRDWLPLPLSLRRADHG